MLSEFHSLHLKLCSKQYYKKNLHLIVAPQLSSGRQHNDSKKNKPGRPGQWAVYVFSYVYGGEIGWYSALFTYLVGWHASVVNLPPSDAILTQLALLLLRDIWWSKF